MLLDVNVLVALAWPSHVHHKAAREWLRVRVSANRSAVDGAVSPAEAITMLDALCGYGSHRFVSDDVAINSRAHVDLDRLLSYKQTTDAHLIELAGRHGTRLVSFDRRLHRLIDGDASVVVEFLSAV